MSARKVQSEDGWTAHAYGRKSVSVCKPDGSEMIHMLVSPLPSDEQLHGFINVAKALAAKDAATPEAPEGRSASNG